MKICTSKYYFEPEQSVENSEAIPIVNAMVVELAVYGIKVSAKLFETLTKQSEIQAFENCSLILKDNTVGILNPPLFRNWEDRTSFSFGEFVVQILTYTLQISGNDLRDRKFYETIKEKSPIRVKFVLDIAARGEALSRLQSLLKSKVTLASEDRSFIFSAARVFSDEIKSEKIYSDEARIALLMGQSQGKHHSSLLLNFQDLGCRPSDALRYAAALKNFNFVTLPRETKYASLSWGERIAIFDFLSTFDAETFCEEVGRNREAWKKFFLHTHFFSQKNFVRRYPILGTYARVAMGHKISTLPQELISTLDKGGIPFDLTDGGALVYRTFASRVNSAVEERDYSKIYSLFSKSNSGYLLRNIASVASGVSKESESDFVELVRSRLDFASPGVLLSILGINVDSEYRIIDAKGDSKVEKANYPIVLKDIQGDVVRAIHARWGFRGKVIVDEELKNRVVPFLSKNTQLGRGTKIPFEDSKNLFFFIDWQQPVNSRTDIDLSFSTFKDGKLERVVGFRNQAYGAIAHSGDITNAPAPNGATEYGKIRISELEKGGVEYVVPIINVFSGLDFDKNEYARAGFHFSDNNNFAVGGEHEKYDLTQPAKANIPFVADIKNREIIVLDFNFRKPVGNEAHHYAREMQQIISAALTKTTVTISRLAEILSGDDEYVSLHIKECALHIGEIEPNNLSTIFEQ